MTITHLPGHVLEVIAGPPTRRQRELAELAAFHGPRLQARMELAIRDSLIERYLERRRCDTTPSGRLGDHRRAL